MWFFLPGENRWKEGKLILENDSLYLCSNKRSKRFFIPFLKKDKENSFVIPIRSIKDVIREERNILTMKHIGNATLSAEDPSSESETLLSTQIAAGEQVLNEVEQELIMRMDASYKFNVYFMHVHAGEGDVLSIKKNVELEKGLLKISNSALWIIGRNSHKRITWDDIVKVEQKKMSRYKSTEFGAISINYFGAEGTNTNTTNVISSTIVIAKGNIIEVLKRHILELLKNA